MTSEVYVPKGYVSLENQSYRGPPPYGRKVPYHSNRGSRGCGCGLLRCCCYCLSCFRCCFCCIFIFILILVAIVVGLYYLVKPTIPTYNVENLDVKAFDIRKDNKLYTEIAVVVKAENPNKDIGLDYGENNAVSLIYSGSELCWGKMPPFLQPGKNTTMVNVVLKGESDFGPEKQNQFMQDQKNGNIPVLITVKVPIRLVIDDFIHMRKFVVNVNCTVVIDQLQPNIRPNIKKKDFTYGIEF
ncbi:NDR1/HIN1-like protein 6 [Gastrolobium bilobum]|uniref:NDR1/HIN1-like protein 6 n=1 Tax=Gastrolobium bilobum TaxID=150636 RepID=UPI002AB08EBC|nr:NDR1/HIN1-like protein 6 [Gastrolobium bilobum]